MAYFDGINKITYEGSQSTNPLAYKHYRSTEVVAGKTMEEHLRFAVSFWHTFTGQGNDPFGLPTMGRSWNGLPILIRTPAGCFLV